jgi:hypothetical protein
VRAALAVRVAQSDKEFQWAKHGVACISRVIIKSSGDYYTAMGISFAGFTAIRGKNAPGLAGLWKVTGQHYYLVWIRTGTVTVKCDRGISISNTA